MALLESRNANSFFFSDEQLNIDVKIRHIKNIKEKDLLGQNFPWADKGPAQSENCLLACLLANLHRIIQRIIKHKHAHSQLH